MGRNQVRTFLCCTAVVAIKESAHSALGVRQSEAHRSPEPGNLSTNRGLPIFSIRQGLLFAHSGLDALLAKGTCAPNWVVHTGELHDRLTPRTSSVGAERNVSEGSLTRSASCRRMTPICAFDMVKAKSRIDVDRPLRITNFCPDGPTLAGSSFLEGLSRLRRGACVWRVGAVAHR